MDQLQSNRSNNTDVSAILLYTMVFTIIRFYRYSHVSTHTNLNTPFPSHRFLSWPSSTWSLRSPSWWTLWLEQSGPGSSEKSPNSRLCWNIKSYRSYSVPEAVPVCAFLSWSYTIYRAEWAEPSQEHDTEQWTLGIFYIPNDECMCFYQCIRSRNDNAVVSLNGPTRIRRWLARC